MSNQCDFDWNSETEDPKCKSARIKELLAELNTTSFDKIVTNPKNPPQI